MAVLSVGIDLGTTNCCVAAEYEGEIAIIPNESGNNTTPSYISFWEDKRLYGEDAKHQQAVNPANTVYDVKRLIGREFTDKNVKEDLKNWPFTVKNVKGNPVIQVMVDGKTKQFAPEELSGMLLSHLKEMAENFLGTTVTSAVITVPAYFNEAQRQATKDAARIAGLDVLRLLNEPTAAAIAYGINKNAIESRNVLVFDLGGGTFDITVLSCKDKTFNIKATYGDTHLGGEDFNNVLLDFALQNVESDFSTDLSRDKEAIGRLRTALEHTKCQLSKKQEEHIRLESLIGNEAFEWDISREEFNKLNEKTFGRIIECMKKALEEAHLEKQEIDDIVLVGGSSRIPKIQSMITEFFNNKTPSKGVHPDEAVAYGAAILARSLLHNDKDDVIALHDIIPLSLGVQIREGLMFTMLKRNTKIPAKRTQEFRTLFHEQDEVEIKVYEGERELVEDNFFLGKATVCDIPALPAGKAQIIETFEVDANGIINVTAVVKGEPDKQLEVKFKMNGCRTEIEIDRMVENQKKYQELDSKRRAVLYARNCLETAAYNFMSQIRKNNQDVTYQQVVIDKCEEVLEWLSLNPTANISAVKNQLQNLNDAYDHPEDVVSGTLPKKGTE